MSHLFLDKSPGRLALYIHGDLQFDSTDEKLYHEPLAAAADIAAARRPGKALRALILGGGDGLAARELLRRPHLSVIDLVERDATVLALGRGELRALNGGALLDARVTVHQADARDALPRARGYDLIVYDLTYPDDAEGAALFSLERFAQARRALRPSGVLALNAVSPEFTPRAFACIGATLHAARLRPLAFAREIPSFSREGYGRWGFYFASARRLSLREAGAVGLADGLRLPASLGKADVKANRNGELLQYLFEARPLPWQGPFRPLRPGPAAGPGPVLTAADGFSRWLSAPRGRRTLDRLLRSLPLSQRHQTRAAVLEWSQQAEAIMLQADPRSFADELLRRASGLPRAWRQELRLLQELPGPLDWRGAAQRCYRALAVLMIVLLLANLCFPDNLYAKGFSSHYGGGGGASAGFSFSAPSHSPYRFRSPEEAGVHFRFGRYRPGFSHVRDPMGARHPSQTLLFTDPQGAQIQTTEDLLALSADLHVLESGQVSLRTGLPDYQAILGPSRLQVFDRFGREVAVFLPPAALIEETRRKLSTQAPLLERATREHRKWLDWIAWSSPLPTGKTALSELAALERMRQAVMQATAAFAAVPETAATPSPTASASAVELFPGVMLETPLPPSSDPPSLVLFGADGAANLRSVLPPILLGEEDKFLYRLMAKRFGETREQALAGPLAAWAKAHAEVLSPAPRSQP